MLCFPTHQGSLIINSVEWFHGAVGASCFVKFLLQRNSGAKKGGNVDQGIKGGGLVFGKITSLEDLMMFYLKELLRQKEVRAVLGGGGGNTDKRRLV